MLVYQSVYSLTFCLNQYFQAGAGFVSINSQKNNQQKIDIPINMGISLLGHGARLVVVWVWLITSSPNKTNKTNLTFSTTSKGHGKHSHPTCRLVPIKVCTSLVRSTSRGLVLLTVSGDDPPSIGGLFHPDPPGIILQENPPKNRKSWKGILDSR